jgi:Na+/melibiose symporter-like transporter
MAFLIFRLYDAFFDPVMGWISDNFRSCWGRRKPFIMAGAILMAFTFPLMWHINREWSEIKMFVWLLATGGIFYTCFSLWLIPYQGLLLEISPDTHERTGITALKAFFLVTQHVGPDLVSGRELPVRFPTRSRPDTRSGPTGCIISICNPN